MKKYRLKYAYWGWKEFWAVILPKGDALAKLKEALHRISGSNDVVLLNSGRAAIRVALQVFKKKEPNKKIVLVPSYVCWAVVEAITDEGLTPHYVDVDNNLNMSLERLNTQDMSNVLAVIAVHNYGFPIDIEAICSLALEKQIFVIDDAAAIQGLSHNGRILGSFGDYGVYSFAQSKTLVSGRSGSGGALLINNTNLNSECLTITDDLPTSKNGFLSAVHFAYSYIFEKYTKNFAYYLWRIFGEGKWQNLPVAKMTSVNAAILLSQMQKLSTIVEGKKKAVELYEKILTEYPEIEHVQDIKDKYLIKLMVNLPTGVTPMDAMELLKEEGVQTRRPYGLSWADENISCEYGAKMAASMIELPLFADMTEEDMRNILDRFIKVIKQK